MTTFAIPPSRGSGDREKSLSNLTYVRFDRDFSLKRPFGPFLHPKKSGGTATLRGVFEGESHAYCLPFKQHEQSASGVCMATKEVS